MVQNHGLGDGGLGFGLGIGAGEGLGTARALGVCELVSGMPTVPSRLPLFCAACLLAPRLCTWHPVAVAQQIIK